MTADALPRIDSQYATGLSRSNIERALLAAGKDLNHLQVARMVPDLVSWKDERRHAASGSSSKERPLPEAARPAGRYVRLHLVRL
jgi:hypothetical protein